MKVRKQLGIRAEPAAIYRALLDAEVLKACIPGASSVTGSRKDGFQVAVTLSWLKASLWGGVRMTNLVKDTSLTITGESKGAAQGLAKAVADVVLEADGQGGTVLSYDVGIEVGKLPAHLGGQLVGVMARKMANQFFANLRKTVEARANGTPEGAGEPGWLKRITGRQ